MLWDWFICVLGSESGPCFYWQSTSSALKSHDFPRPQ